MPAADTTATARGPVAVLARELGAFGLVGGACFVLDLAMFQLLYDVVGLGAVTSKLLATLLSMTAAFLGHRFWSFAHRQQRGLREGYVRFAVINAVTLGIGLAIVATVRYPLGQEGVLALQVANVGSIAVGTAIRWMTYRRWVFPALAGADEGVSAPSRR